MPKIYLSPSLQEFNEFVNGGNEEQYMNLIADALEPYLYANGIEFTRNNPEQSLSEVINQSNQGNYDLHLALHSNAAPPSLSGKLKGADIYYYPTSKYGNIFANILADNYENIYPEPERVNTMPTTVLGELKRTKAPSVLVETAYHDNPEDAQWIKDNINNIAETLARSLTEYFGMPFVDI